MKVLDIAPSSTDSKWALLDGNHALPRNLPLPYTSRALPADREMRKELRELATASSGVVDEINGRKVVDRSLTRAASEKGLISFGRMRTHVRKSPVRVVDKAVSPDLAVRYQATSEMVGDLKAMRLSGWRPVPCGEQHAGNEWSGRDWRIGKDPKKPEQWAVRRSRQSVTNSRRRAAAENARADCRLVMEAAA